MKRILKVYKEKRKAVNGSTKEHEAVRQNPKASNSEEFVNDGNFRKNITFCEDFPNRVMRARNNLGTFLRSALASKKNDI